MKIFVGNLAREVTEDDLREAFSAHGQVASVAVIRDRQTGQVRGFGFVEMPNETEARAALAALNGATIKGNALRVSEAHGQGPTRGGRGGGGTGRGHAEEQAG